MSVEYSYIHPKYLLRLLLTGSDLVDEVASEQRSHYQILRLSLKPLHILEIYSLACSSRILVPQAKDCFWHKSPNTVTTSRLAARINILFKLQCLLIWVQKLFHLSIYLCKSAGSRLLFKAVAFLIRLVWGQTEEGVQTISSTLISKTPVPDKNKSPLCREFSLPQEQDPSPFSQCFYKACDIFKATFYHVSPVSLPIRIVLSFSPAERKTPAFSNFLPPTVKHTRKEESFLPFNLEPYPMKSLISSYGHINLWQEILNVVLWIDDSFCSLH